MGVIKLSCLLLMPPQNNNNTKCTSSDMAKLLVVGKVVLVGSLVYVFLRYFGLVSWEKYQSQNVYVTKSWERPDFLPLPTITICPQDLESGHAFKNVTKELDRKAKEEGKGLLEYVCEDLEGKDLIECAEREALSLSDFVKFEITYTDDSRIQPDTVEMNPPVESHWRMSFNRDKGPCFTYQNNHHMETKGMLKIGLNASLKHRVFIHDPRFFINSGNPALPIGSKFVNPGDWQLRKLTVIEHRNLDVPNKRCNPGQNYSLTECVWDVFSKDVGCVLHWDQNLIQDDLPICSTAEQHR